MNKFINILLIAMLIPTMFITIYVGLDLPIGFLHVSGHNLPYRDEILLGFGVLMFVVILRKSIRRWMGVSIVSKVKKFVWNAEISQARKSRVRMYLIMESVVMLTMAIGLYMITEVALPPALALALGTLDNIIFGLVPNKYRVGISSKALIIADREVILIYFSGLRKVSSHQQSIYFDYIKGLQLAFPTNCVDDSDKAKFFEVLEEQVDTDRVFFSKTMNKVETPTS
ncbi:MAG: hypothetical protein ACI865_000656 [Flavobacteriaceae bacterium]|jgi:hypothetical protein